MSYGGSLPRPGCRDRKREEKERLLLQSSSEEDRTRHRHLQPCGVRLDQREEQEDLQEEWDIKARVLKRE